jgi:hypothetical protein
MMTHGSSKKGLAFDRPVVLSDERLDGESVLAAAASVN